MDRPADLLTYAPFLVLAPHADDEALGCGALLADCWRNGTPAHVVCMTDGAASHPRSALNLASIRACEMADAVTILGGDPRGDLTWLGFPDAALHEVSPASIADILETLVHRLGSRCIIAPSPLDPHCDHVTTASIAETLVARLPHLTLLHYPIWSRWIEGGEAPPVPGTWRLSYSVDAALKARAIAAHASQQGKVIRDDPDGFTMPDGFARMFAEGPEIFDVRSA